MKDDFVYIEHIMLCINKIQDYTKGLEQINFNENELIQDAVIRNIEIMAKPQRKFHLI